MTDKPDTEPTSTQLKQFNKNLDALEPEMKERIIEAANKSQELPNFERGEDGGWSIKLKDPVTYMRMFGGSTTQFCHAMMSVCGNVSGTADSLDNDKNHAVAIVAEIAPQDGIEAMLATQMAAVHIAMMRHSRQMAGAETIAQLDVQEKVFNKLARTFAAQVEALRKHRHGGQQKMTVEHVTVEKGGQAIVGNVTKGGGSK